MTGRQAAGFANGSQCSPRSDWLHSPVVGAPGSADSWAVSTEESPFYDQLTDYVYQIKVQPAGVVASFGTIPQDFYEPNYTGSGLASTSVEARFPVLILISDKGQWVLGAVPRDAPVRDVGVRLHCCWTGLMRRAPRSRRNDSPWTRERSTT